MQGKKYKGSIYLSTCHNPWFNQAFEEDLLNCLKQDEVVFYLWQNQKTVVIGRHQNAWKEADWAALQKDGGYLARRITGGGAVYHDLGNINFTFIAPADLYDVTKQLSVILHAVLQMGVPARFTGRNDLEAEGKKFSGNAFCHRKDGSMHHGTLLIDSDFCHLSAYLLPSPQKILSKGVDSVAARVINLKELNPMIDVPTCKDVLCRSFAQIYQDVIDNLQVVSVDTSDDTFGDAALKQKFTSWEWRFGASPTFSITLQNRFDWGDFELCCNNDGGNICQCVIYSDALDADLITRLQNCLINVPFCQALIQKAWKEIPENPQQEAIVSQLIQWLEIAKI